MAISTPRDSNRAPTLIGTLNTDGSTPVSIAVNPSNHALKVMDGTTGSNFTTKTTSQRDANRVPAIWGVSSADGTTPIYIATNSAGALLIKST